MARHDWTAAEDAAIFANYRVIGRAGTAALLGLPRSSVGGRARRLGLQEPLTDRPPGKRPRPRKPRTCTACHAVFQPETRYVRCCSVVCCKAVRAAGIRARHATRPPKPASDPQPRSLAVVSLSEAFRWARANGLEGWDIFAVHALRRAKKKAPFKILKGALGSGVRAYSRRCAA